jgi:hypothetical protein
MVSILVIDNGIKEPTHRCQNSNTNQILIFGRGGGYVKVRECVLYTRVYVLGMRVLTWYIDPHGIKIKKIWHTIPCLIDIKKCKIVHYNYLNCVCVCVCV